MENIDYPECEVVKRDLLLNLFDEWEKQVDLHLGDDAGVSSKDLVFDGFHPYYFSKKVRVLFVGREARGLTGDNYIEVLNHVYRYGKRVGKRSLNGSAFHRRMLYIAYSLVFDDYEWRSMPNAEDIGDDFGTDHGLSFAFMNLSKFSNDTDSWSAQIPLMECSIRASTDGTNLIQKEVEILDPHVVITMNLDKSLELLGDVKYLESKDGISIHELKLANSTALLLDAYHFSAPGKMDKEDFVDPIRNAYYRYKDLIS